MSLKPRSERYKHGTRKQVQVDAKFYSGYYCEAGIRCSKETRATGLGYLESEEGDREGGKPDEDLRRCERAGAVLHCGRSSGASSRSCR